MMTSFIAIPPWQRPKLGSCLTRHVPDQQSANAMAACRQRTQRRLSFARPRRGGQGVDAQPSRLTPLAMTRTDSMIAETDSTAISILARWDSGIVSVGLKAEELVIET